MGTICVTACALLMGALLPAVAALDARSSDGFTYMPLFDEAKGSLTVPDGRAPYMASIKRAGCHEHVCSGVLVRKQWVLTPAHCVDPKSAYSAGKKPIVHLNDSSAGEAAAREGEGHIVIESIVHEDWDGNQRSPYNVALLKLPEVPEQDNRKVPQILENHFTPATGQKLVALGYGPSGDAVQMGSEIFGTLKMEQKQYIASEQCNRKQLWDGEVPEDLPCGMNNRQRASCTVDSGSPLLLADLPKNIVNLGKPELDILVGINLDGASCGSPGKPDIYTDMRKLGAWVLQKTALQ